MLAPLGGREDVPGTAGPFTRAQPALVAEAMPIGAPQAMPVAAPPAMPTPAAQAAATPPPAPRRRAASAAAPGGAAPAGTPTRAALDDSAGSVVHSVAKYAAFCAACAEFPDRLPQTMAGYGVPDDAARAALDRQWQDRFDDDADLLTKWEELFQSFRTSLRALG
jgi:hypothetical protein